MRCDKTIAYVLGSFCGVSWTEDISWSLVQHLKDIQPFPNKIWARPECFLKKQLTWGQFTQNFKKKLQALVAGIHFVTAEKYICRRNCLYSCRYDPSTGIFTVPPGGDGLYYFSTYLLVDDGEVGYFNIRVNGEVLCSAVADETAGGDYPQAICSGLAQLTEGKPTGIITSLHLKKVPKDHWSRLLFMFDEIFASLVRSQAKMLPLPWGNVTPPLMCHPTLTCHPPGADLSQPSSTVHSDGVKEAPWPFCQISNLVVLF